MRWRYEDFGAVIASERPPLLAFVDRAFVGSLGLPPDPDWQGPQPPVGLLRAPTEVHLATTNRCDAGCAHCYMDAGAAEAAELDTEGMRAALRRLGELGVFHVALGGGEALLRDDLWTLAAAAREFGLVPNLTVSGRGVDAALARRMTVFGQVNVSMDSASAATFAVHGRSLPFREADAAVRALVAAGVPCGVNCVLGRDNFGELGGLFAYAAERGLNEVEVLRFKPAGRGATVYASARCTDEQHLRLVPRLQELSALHGVPAKIDCSLVPMLCAHSPPIELLEALCTYGCEAGNVLLGARADGRVCGCSFLPPLSAELHTLSADLASVPALRELRTWYRSAPAPCNSCPYLSVCKGGCRAVSSHVLGDPLLPDPECPRVLAAARPPVTR